MAVHARRLNWFLVDRVRHLLIVVTLWSEVRMFSWDLVCGQPDQTLSWMHRFTYYFVTQPISEMKIIDNVISTWLRRACFIQKWALWHGRAVQIQNNLRFSAVLVNHLIYNPPGPPSRASVKVNGKKINVLLGRPYLCSYYNYILYP